MLPEKTGIKSIFRTPVRSLLFLALLALLTAMLSLGFCVTQAIRAYLSECESFYHSIAELEYLGSEYPDSHVYDAGLEAAIAQDAEGLEKIRALEGCIAYENTNSALGVVKDVSRTDTVVYDKNEAVLDVYIMTYDKKSGAYVGYIRECLHSMDDNTGVMVFISRDGIDPEGEEGTLKKSSSYIFSGYYFSGKSSYIWFRTAEFTYRLEDEQISLPIMCKAPAEGETSEEAERYRELAAVMDARDNGFRVEYVSDLEYYRPFQQEELKISSGRSFTDEDYASEASAVIISSTVASFCEVSVGDRIDLYVVNGDGNIYDPDLSKLREEKSYEVVGIYDATDDYPDTILIPDAGANTRRVSEAESKTESESGFMSEAESKAGSESGFMSEAESAFKPVTGYSVGTFILENRKAEAFLEAAEALLPEGFRLTLYDQGYAGASEPYREMLKIAGLFLLVTFIITFAVLALYCSLFVLRHEEVVRTMQSLGTGGLQVGRYFMSGAVCMFVFSAAAGVLIGRAMEQRVLGMIADFAARFANSDNRYSSSALTIVRTLDFSPKSTGAVYVAASFCLFVLLLLFTAVFSAIVIRRSSTLKLGGGKRKAERRKSKKSIRNSEGPGGSSRMSGALKYGMLSVRRGGARTLAVLLLIPASLIFFGVLLSSAERYSAQLATVRNESEIRGNVTDKKGRALSGIVLRVDNAQKLITSELLTDITFGRQNCNFRLLGVARTADGTDTGLPEFEFPESSFAIETLQNQLAREPLWITTNRIAGTPDFYFEQNPEIDWLSGYSEADLSGNEASIAVISRTMAEREGIKNGDMIRVLTNYSRSRNTSFGLVELLVVGIYQPVNTEETMYTPYDYAMPVIGERVVTDEEEEANGIEVSEGEQETEAAAGAENKGNTDESGRVVPQVTDHAYTWYDHYSSTEDRTLKNITIHFFTFRVKDSGRLTELREYLSKTGISPAKSEKGSRNYLVLEDASYLSMVRSMERQQKYMELLFGFLEILVMITAFFSAWLLALSRKKEIAIMRLLGTGSARILANFISEQLLLFAVGAAIAIPVVLFKLGAPQAMLWKRTVILLACWSGGTAAGVVRQCIGREQIGMQEET